MARIPPSNERDTQRMVVRVGVTGHRFLSDRARITTKIDLVLQRIQEAFACARLTVVSELAIGADQVVAHRALALPGTRLVVSLPMPLEQYMEDFETLTARRDFIELFHCADEIRMVPTTPTRDDAYHAAGVYIVEHSDVMIAIWDGQPARGRGGTAEIVALAREHGLLLAWIRTTNHTPDGGALSARGERESSITFERFPF